MPGTDVDSHALAADIRCLSRKIDTMQQEGREWRDTQIKIFEEMANNNKAIEGLLQRISSLSTRQSELERDVSALLAWKWRSVGVLSAAIFLFNWLSGNA